MKPKQLIIYGILAISILLLGAGFLRYTGASGGQTQNPAGDAKLGLVQVGDFQTANLQISYLQEASWTQNIHFPDATYIKVHFDRFNLQPGDYVTVSSPDGAEVYTYPGSDFTFGEEGGFWAISIFGDTALVELQRGDPDTAAYPDDPAYQKALAGAPLESLGVFIDRYARGFPQEVLADMAGSQESTCGTNERTDVVCYQGTHPTEYGKSNAVARLLINSAWLCTSWRVTPNNFMFTNEHCITSQTDVTNTEVWFNYQRTVCESGGANTPTVVTGSTFLVDDATLDFALFTVNSFATISGFGYLELDNRTPILGEEIYLPQHGEGNPKEFGIESDMDTGNVCKIDDAITDGNGPSTDTGYFCDTAGGSSGSPVLARSSHQVIALHHFGTGGLACNATTMNQGVRIDLIYPIVAPFLYTGTVGPVSYDDHLVDDDSIGNSAGNANGVAECGEAVELFVDLANLGSDPATGVAATLSTSDPYVTFIFNISSAYPDIPAGGVSTNTDDFDLQLAPDTPDGHVVDFDLNISASNGGPWTSSFAMPVLCAAPADVLLVDDDDNSPDVRSFYTTALDNLGLSYYVWDTFNSDLEPDAATLANYGAVVWFTGHEWGGYAGPGPVGEAALGSYLDGGGCLLISAQDYLYDRGLTPFMTNYLGLDSYVNDQLQTTVSGAGSVYGGMGPYTLSYPYLNFSDLLNPSASAELAFVGDAGNAAVDKLTASYFTTLLGYPLDAIPDVSNRSAVLAAFIQACGVQPTEPDIYVVPWSLSSTQPPGVLRTRIFDIWNWGTANLNWEIYEAPAPVGGGLAPAQPVPGDPAVATEDVGDQAAEEAVPSNVEVFNEFTAPETQLYNNGPWTNSFGTGAGGADESVVQTSLLMSTLGFGHQVSVGNRIADDFTVSDPSGWIINNITFFAYQSGSTLTSPITAVHLQIWDGPPDAGGSVIWGDTATNRLVATGWAGVYRVTDTTSGDSYRPMMYNMVSLGGLFLPQGTYWLDWQADGDPGLTGPWAPPIVVTGQTTTGNALQWTTAWAPAIDNGSGTQQGFPFLIEGELAGCPNGNIPWVNYVNPYSGDTAPGSNTPVGVVIDSTGMSPGTYTADLCIASNDPDENPTLLPLTLVVTEAPDISVSPLSGFDFLLPPDQTDSDTLTISNTGFGDLYWLTNAATFAVDVVGDWNLHFDWGCSGSPGTAPISLYDDFTFSAGGIPGKWMLNENSIVWVFDGYETDYAGVVTGDLMEGTMMSNDGGTGCFTADRVVTTPEPADPGTQPFPAAGSFPLEGQPNRLLEKLPAAAEMKLDHYLLARPEGGEALSPDLDGAAVSSVPPAGEALDIALLADLTGVNILYDLSHGQRSIASQSILQADLEARGAVVVENEAPITGDLLAGYDILWVDEWGDRSWLPREMDVVFQWVQAGNGVIFHGDEVSTGESLAAMFDISFTGVPGTAGATTQISSHPVTAGISQVYLSNPMNSLAASGTATCIVQDISLVPHVCVNTVGQGRVIAVADDDFFDSIIPNPDNQLLGNQAFDWLAGAGDSWLFAAPSAGQTPYTGSSLVEVVVNSTGMSPGVYEGGVFVFSNDPDERIIGVPVTLEVGAVGGCVEGDLTLQSRADHSGAEITIWSGPVLIDSGFTDPAGAYSVPVPPGTYTVLAEMDRYLDGEKAGVVVSAGVCTPLNPVTLLGGDANDDCVINILDLSFMGARFGTSIGNPLYDPKADINNDGTINILDLSVTGGNFNKTCPVPWP